MSGSVTIANDESASGSGLALDLYNKIKSVETTYNPLPSLTPPGDWKGTEKAWTDAIEPIRLKMLRAWAREATRHAKMQVGTWHNVEYKGFTSSATSYTFSGLDGDTHKLYRLHGRIYTSGATVVLTIQPNGQSSNQYDTNIAGSGTAASSGNNADMRIVSGLTAKPWVVFESLFYASKVGPGAVATPRLCLTSTGRISVTAADVVVRVSIWNETTTNLTSLVLNSSAGWGIAQGSEVWLDRMIQP